MSKILAGIVTLLPKNFPLETGGSIEVFEEEILYKAGCFKVQWRSWNLRDKLGGLILENIRKKIGSKISSNRGNTVPKPSQMKNIYYMCIAIS